MLRRGLMGIMVLVAGVILFLSGSACATPDKAGDGLTYGYYTARGGANFMTVSQSSSCAIPVPTAKQAFTYTPVAEPVPACTAAEAKPIGVGEIAKGGDTVELSINVGPFEAPVDVSIGLFAAAFDATDIYFINAYDQLTSVQEEVLTEVEAESASPSKSSNGQGNGQDKNNSGTGNGNAGNGQGNGQSNGQGNSQAGNNNGNGNGQGPVADDQKPRKKFRKLTAWKTSVTEVDQIILPETPANVLPSGLYVIVLNVTRVSPADNNFDRFYRWITYFIIPDR